MNWNFSKRLGARVAAMAAVVLAPWQMASAAIDASFSGSWYSPGQSGHGVVVEVTGPTTASFAWYTYDNLGHQAWVVGSGTINGNTIQGQAFITRNMVFGTFTPAPVVDTWGVLQMTFTGCDQGTLSWTSSYNGNGLQFANGSTPISRLTDIQGLSCSPLAGLYSGFIGNLSAYAFIDTDNKLTMVQSNTQAMYQGTVTANDLGTTFTFNGDGITGPGANFGGGTTTTFTGNGTFLRHDSATASYSGSRLAAGTWTLLYDPRYTRGASLAALAGNYIIDLATNTQEKITISASGAITNNDNTGCSLTGQISIPNARYNIYQTTLTVTNCGNAGGTNLNGAFVGPSALIDNNYGDSKVFLLGLRSPNFALIRAFVRQ